MPTTTNSELIAILRSRKTPGALTKMNRKQLEALVESTGGTPRPSASRENLSTMIKLIGGENEKLKAEAIISQDSYVEQYKAIAALKGETEQMKREIDAHADKIKELKENELGIMEEEGTGHILGCNPYEKFCAAMSELNYDEKWISEMKIEIEKLKEELELSRAFNERFRQGHEMCEVYKGRCIGIEMENKELKGRVDIMEKCKKVWYEDPDDDPDRSGIKWSICLEGGLNYFMKEAIRYEESYDEIKAEKVNLIEAVGELRDYIELNAACCPGGNQNEIDVFNKIFDDTDVDLAEAHED